MNTTKEQKELNKMPKSVVTFHDVGEGLKVTVNHSMSTPRLEAVVRVVMRTMEAMMEQANKAKPQEQSEPAEGTQLDLVDAAGGRLS